MFQLCIIKTSTAVNPNFFLFWSRPHLLLEVNSLQMQIGLACAWGAALGSLDSSAPPRLLSFIFLVAALTLVCDVQPVPPCVRHVFRDCVNR